MTRLVQYILLLGTVLWLGFTAIASFSKVPELIAHSLSSSLKPDHAAARIANIARQEIPITASTSIWYVDGADGGDNYYRVRYLLYPAHFVDYWSWNYPNAGGHVWNTPRFSQSASARQVLLANHVNYVLAVRHPNFLNLLGRVDQGLYIFQVDQKWLRAGVPLKRALKEVGRWS